MEQLANYYEFEIFFSSNDFYVIGKKLNRRTGKYDCHDLTGTNSKSFPVIKNLILQYGETEDEI